MKKPLILLVDDDPMVLEALESELAPAFGEICRIEAFDDPRGVLEARARWMEENRPVGVAIVDQKMPHLTGVELLASLRTSGLGSETRAVLLTGYAGLDSAIAAKNEAAVDRYLEKPWSGEDLAWTIRVLLRRYLNQTRTDKYFVFRELGKPEEVREHLGLRFQVYRMTKGGHLLPAAESGLDADAYDPVSRFYGLFAEGGEQAHMIGTLRVTEQRRGPAAGLLLEIVGPFQDLVRIVEGPRPHPLPMMKYLIDREAVADLFETFTARGEKVVEPGRLTVHPEFRSAAPGTGARHLARHLIEGAAAYVFFHYGIENVILTCCAPHDMFYRPLGFKDAERTERRYHEDFGDVVLCLHGRKDTVPASPRKRVESLAARIALRGGACHCATFPACLAGPYETGDFLAVDLLCPMRATDLLGRSGTDPLTAGQGGPHPRTEQSP